VSFAAVTLCVASQRVFIVVVVVYFVIDSVRKLLDTPSYLKFRIKNRIVRSVGTGIAAEDFQKRKKTLCADLTHPAVMTYCPHRISFLISNLPEKTSESAFKSNLLWGQCI
jgi:hypothetical protein